MRIRMRWSKICRRRTQRHPPRTMSCRSRRRGRTAFDDAWQRALAGEPTAAFQELTELLAQTPGRADLYARLYWLAAVFPEIDSEQSPAEWLCAESIRLFLGAFFSISTPRRSPRIHKKQNRCASALARPRAIGRRTFRVVHMRWETICRRSRWSIVLEEFQRIRDRIRLRDELVWLRLVAELIRWIAWGRDDIDASDLQAVARAELQSLEHLGLQHSYFFDGVEWLDVLIDSWETARDQGEWPNEFLAVLRDGYALPMSQIRVRFERVLQRICEEPVRWIRLFDRVGAAGTAVLSHLAGLMTEYEAERGADQASTLPPAQLLEVATAELGRYAEQPEFLRAAALRFCLDEGVTPIQIVEASPSCAWLARLQADRSLILVSRAFQVFCS